MKIGRNDPCPCGSGKKYKKCCMLKEQPSTLMRIRILKTYDELIPKLMNYAYRLCGPEVIEAALEDFPESAFDAEPYKSPFYVMFVRWLVFLWEPLTCCPHIEDDGTFPSQLTIGARYLKQNRSKLDPFGIKCLEAALRETLSFWQVEGVEVGKGLLIKDLITGKDRHVEEVEGTRRLRRWDIIFANVMGVDGTCVFNIMGPYSLPASSKEAILHMVVQMEMDDLPGSGDLTPLYDLEYELTEYYIDLVDELFQPKLPELQNMDGEPLSLTTSVYRFDPAHRNEILDRLASSGVFRFEDEIGHGSAELLWVDSPDMKGPFEEVTKGRIEVRKKFLETECNSAGRDKELREMLTNLLGEMISFQKVSSMPFLSDRPVSGQYGSMDPGEAPLDPNELPQGAKADLQGHLDQMYLKWADTSVPALGNITPREAVKDKAGRERVIVLINDWENMQSRMGSSPFQFDFNKLRLDLGLPEE